MNEINTAWCKEVLKLYLPNLNLDIPFEKGVIINGV